MRSFTHFFRRSPPNMSILHRLFLGLCLLCIPLFASQAVNELIEMPSARFEKMGFVEIGTFLDYELVNSTTANMSALLSPSFFFRAALTNRLQYSLSVNREMTTLHSFNVRILSKKNQRRSWETNWSAGVKNLGWKKIEIPSGFETPNFPVLNIFSVLSFTSLKSRAGYHIGIATDYLKRSSKTPFFGTFGIEKPFLKGSFVAEWNGDMVNMGLKYYFKNANTYLSWRATEPSDTHPDHYSKLYSIGFSYRTSLLDELKKIIVTHDQLVDVEDKLKTRLVKLEERDELETIVRSSHFLEDLEKSMVEAVIDPDGDESSLPMKRAFSHMQLGLEAFYNGQFDKALQEYKVVTEIMPNSAVGYIRLGSIHYQMKHYDEARQAWEKAAVLDKDNLQLKSYLSTLPDQKPPRLQRRRTL